MSNGSSILTMTPKRIIVHHSFTKDSETVSWGAIRTYHVKELGWFDIGYHAGVELVANGDNSYYEVLLGRMWNVIGAHTRGANLGSLGICFVGNFDEVEPPGMQLNVGAKLIKLWMELFSIQITEIYPHSHFNPKTCPGNKFSMEKLKEIIKTA